MTTRAIDAAILELADGEIRLLGGRCAECGEIQFPAAESCRRCGGDRTAVVRLSQRGLLWSWTVQRFPPPSPPAVPRGEEFQPYGVGYVELPGEVIVEALLTESDPARLRIGMSMRLVPLEVLTHCGEPATTFAFAPVEQGDR
ncbi:OB-fold domain-containing protein [Nocardia sp. CDC159]|uniref:OB-fold domain-containing protein n=1 Tax=Nocardia pulmonis TaxID=2951408 RepID=A0A9X2IW78_9NOCA|nr:MULTISPECIES: OB-fold domain-containing protein [Nocardia]MCM6772555.1 OB-fold domain-containing protein [Nocardia pulmonis]MCM6784787.1 OB-fold domain-containing protein [Nocardia sp. CDC159]